MLLDLLLSWLAPQICQGCGRVGSGLCEDCKIDIIDEPYSGCLVCGSATDFHNICFNCRVACQINRAFVIGRNKGLLKNLLYSYKFAPMRGLARDIAGLIDLALPNLPAGTVLVPIPTTARHIRQRGFGHIELVARILAKKRSLRYTPLLIRRNNSVQHGLKAKDRARSAAKALALDANADIPAEVLLIDDIYTTGSTVRAAVKLLKKAGVKTINLLIIARQKK